ncbi:hypothetical protein SSCG_06216 [Streptomyces clavuligerus]|nr:hypothetical protein SSCG_06216 [Streptomyces clavuligerus]
MCGIHETPLRSPAECDRNGGDRGQVSRGSAQRDRPSTTRREGSNVLRMPGGNGGGDPARVAFSMSREALPAKRPRQRTRKPDGL